MTRISDDQLSTVARVVAENVRAVVPDWTEPAAADPGTTLLQVFQFLAEQLLFRDQPLSEQATRSIARITTVLNTLRDAGDASFEGLTRVHYFFGQRLSADDLQTEQDYVRAKHRRHNQLLHGTGVVSGLQVTVGDASTHDAPVVSVDAGYAIAPNGEDLFVGTCLTCRLSATTTTGFVTLEYAERLASPVPDVVDAGANQFSRIQEGIRVAFAEQATGNVIALAKLERHHGEWRIASDFHPPRADG
jgi:hypothetical protein